MAEADDLPFKVGQLAESKSFEDGYRGAWFRSKIQEIGWRKGQIAYFLKFYDFSDEDADWTPIYQVPPVGRKTKVFGKHLMVRPKYPPMYHEGQVPHRSSIAEVSVVVEGPWKVGHLVDWREKNCYWSGRVTKVLDNDKVQIELPMPPAGEGESYEACCRDLRPSLSWSPKVGWAVPNMEGSSPCARLLYPLTPDHVDSKKLPNLKIAPTDKGVLDVQAGTMGSLLGASFSSHISANLLVPRKSITSRQSAITLSTTVSEDEQRTQEANTGIDVGEGAIGRVSSSNSISTSHIGEALAETARHSTPHIEDAIAETMGHASEEDLGGLPYNSTSADTLEAAILDLEELANKIKWMKAILEFGTPVSSDLRPAWRFVEHRPSSTPD